MTFPPYSEIPVLLDAARAEELPKLVISVLRNIVLEPIEPYLRYLALDMGFGAEVRFGQFDNVYQEAVGGDAQLLSKETDCVLVCLYPEQLFPKLANQFAGLSEADIQTEIERIHTFVEEVIAGIRRQTDGLICWQVLSGPSIRPWECGMDRSKTASLAWWTT